FKRRGTSSPSSSRSDHSWTSTSAFAATCSSGPAIAYTDGRRPSSSCSLMRQPILALLVLVPTPLSADKPKVRNFKFIYETTVTDLKPDQEARIWLPVPQTTDDQEVLKFETTFPVEAAV